jgi:PhnB protein
MNIPQDYNSVSPYLIIRDALNAIQFYKKAFGAIETAVSAGAKIIRPMQDQFFGDRSCAIEDPFGHLWSIATRKENITREEMLKRFNEMMK